MTDGPNGDYSTSDKSSFETIKINILNLGQRPQPGDYRGQRFSATGVMEYRKVTL
jgi:hypothetical protein